MPIAMNADTLLELLDPKHKFGSGKTDCCMCPEAKKLEAAQVESADW